MSIVIFRIVLAFIFIHVLALPACAQLPGVAGQDRAHLVHSGQSLLKIALHYGLGPAQVAQANAISSDQPVDAGRVLRIPGRRILPAGAPRNGIVVNLAERMLYLFKDGTLENSFPVAIGMAGRFKTPTGRYKIISMVKNPTWLPPAWAGLDEKVVPAGADNPLGDRWIGLSAPGIGFHATSDRTSVGTPASHGCMRMIPDMVEALFKVVKKGMAVHIVYETAVLGYDPASGQFVMAAFPDVYGQSGPLGHARRLLAQSGLDSFVDPSIVARMAKRHDGRAVVVLTARTRVVVHGKALALTLPPLSQGGELWVPISVAKAAGAVVRYNAARRLLLIDRQGVELTYHVGGGTDATATTTTADVPAHAPRRARVVAGQTYVPARALLDGLRIAFTMDGRTLSIP